MKYDGGRAAVKCRHRDDAPIANSFSRIPQAADATPMLQYLMAIPPPAEFRALPPELCDPRLDIPIVWPLGGFTSPSRHYFTSAALPFVEGFLSFIRGQEPEDEVPVLLSCPAPVVIPLCCRVIPLDEVAGTVDREYRIRVMIGYGDHLGQQVVDRYLFRDRPRSYDMPEHQDMHVPALILAQPENPRDAVEDRWRNLAAAPLLQVGVPGGTDPGEYRDFLAPQPRRATAARGRQADLF